MPPAGPGLYSPPLVPARPAKPARRGRSVGCIVLYAFLAIVVVFVGLGVALYAIGSHVLATSAANQAAQRTAAMQSDGLHAYIKDTNHFAKCLDFSSFASATDIAFETQMQILSGDGGGLLFREATFGGGFYYFEVDLGGLYRVYVDKNPPAAPSLLASGTTDAVIALGNATTTLTLIAKGNQFDFYIDQQFVAQVQDATFPDGNIGVIASDHPDSTEVVYTNAKIWDLDS